MKKLTGGKKLSSFYLYRFRKYVSYGFPIMNFCNPGVHYETPYIYMYILNGCLCGFAEFNVNSMHLWKAVQIL